MVVRRGLKWFRVWFGELVQRNGQKQFGGDQLSQLTSVAFDAFLVEHLGDGCEDVLQVPVLETNCSKEEMILDSEEQLELVAEQKLEVLVMESALVEESVEEMPPVLEVVQTMEVVDVEDQFGVEQDKGEQEEELLTLDFVATLKGELLPFLLQDLVVEFPCVKYEKMFAHSFYADYGSSWVSPSDFGKYRVVFDRGKVSHCLHC